MHDDRLQKMFDMQLRLQAGYHKEGKLPQEFEGEERTIYIKDMVLALEDELHELLGEVGWKPWATSRHVNEDAARGELIDAFHFFMNLMMALRMEPEDLLRLYTGKNAVNHNRQESGYTGLEKCPACRRALDDEAVKCQVYTDNRHGVCYQSGMPVPFELQEN